MIMSANSFFFGKCKNQSINSGTYIGQVDDVLNIIQKIYDLNPKNDADDQVLMTKYCNLHPNDLYIDTDNQLFLTLGYPLEQLDKYTNIENGKLTYNGNQPFFIHAPGYGLLDNVITKLGYSYNSNIANEYYSYFLYKKVIMYCKVIFFDSILWLFFGIVGLFIVYSWFSKNNKRKLFK